jgi:hypothetical protein
MPQHSVEARGVRPVPRPDGRPIFTARLGCAAVRTTRSRAPTRARRRPGRSRGVADAELERPEAPWTPVE